MQSSKTAARAFLVLCLLVLGAFVGDSVHGDPKVSHPKHKCVQDTHCRSIVVDPHPDCPALYPMCGSVGSAIFWKCLPDPNFSCNESSIAFGSVECRGGCSRIVRGQLQIDPNGTLCGFVLNFCQ